MSALTRNAATAIVLTSITVILTPSLAAYQLLPGFLQSERADEQVKWSRLESGVRVLELAAVNLGTEPRTLLLFATPNGNTIEQSLGCVPSQETDWRYDIQHIAAQFRQLRELDHDRQYVLAVVQAPKLSWPTFRREQSHANSIIRGLVESLSRDVEADRIMLTCHSGGGSFLFGYINAHEELPENLERIVFLDANYSYSDDDQHGDKLLRWMEGNSNHRLVVVAYDDREITLNGQKVIGPDGGTFRATQRMLTRFRKAWELTEKQTGPFSLTSDLNQQSLFYVHPNPDNKILHTALVGEMNGLIHSATVKTVHESTWGVFGGPRSYSNWVSPQPLVEPPTVRAMISDAEAAETKPKLEIPSRSETAPTGSEFKLQIEALPRDQREALVLRELLNGNLPSFLGQLVPIRAEAYDESNIKHFATYFVMPDYLSIGTDDDFFRMPMTPATAVTVAERFGASLITPKISDDLAAAATVKLDPKPLTSDREAVSAFWEHQQIIESQLVGKSRQSLVVGIKKDVVLTNLLTRNPHKVAIFGWHYPNGQPIQPLYVGHVDWYVDYSHGIRLMSQRMLVDGKWCNVAEVMKNRELNRLISYEAPLDIVEIQNTAWKK